MSGKEPQGHDMSRYWRLVDVTNGRVTGTWWVSAPHGGKVSVRSVDVLVWVDEGHSWGAVLGTKDVMASVHADGSVDLPKHMIFGTHRDMVIDAIDEVKAAIFAASVAVATVWESDHA